MKLISRKRAERRKEEREKVWSDPRKWIWRRDSIGFGRWLEKSKGFKIHPDKDKPFLFWYQETPSSPKITVIQHSGDSNKVLVSVLANDHLNEFFNGGIIRQTEKKSRTTADIYKEYIKSDKWREKSLKCFAEAGYECEVCGSNRDLNAHHYNYRNLEGEPAADLFCLCASCHLLYHKIFPSGNLPPDSSLPREDRLRHIQRTVRTKKD